LEIQNAEDKLKKPRKLGPRHVLNPDLKKQEEAEEADRSSRFKNGFNRHEFR
jgi:hypothetical protein